MTGVQTCALPIYFNVPEVMKCLPTIPQNNIPLTNEFVYKYFKLNNKEISYIEKLVKKFTIRQYNQLQLEVV